VGASGVVKCLRDRDSLAILTEQEATEVRRAVKCLLQRTAGLAYGAQRTTKFEYAFANVRGRTFVVAKFFDEEDWRQAMTGPH
jgi:hypothetical protein